MKQENLDKQGCQKMSNNSMRSMSWYLKDMTEAMDDGTARILDRVHLPQQVALPVRNESQPSLCVMPDGEIRCYGLVDGGRQSGYLSSRDCGLSFKEYYDHGGMGAAVRNPESGRYLRVTGREDGTYCCYSDVGPDDKKPVCRKISDEVYICEQLPRFMTGSRVYVSLYRKTTDGFETAFAYSDNDGEKWKIVTLAPIGNFAAVAPDKGVRYQANGMMPCTIEKTDGSLWMLVSTADDYLWQYTSQDRGESWSEASRTTLHSTHNSADMIRLSDGRLLLLWNNTEPMPEPNHRSQPGCSELQMLGLEPSVYTNRDACHCAVSEDDGANWIGQRELYLTKGRAQADYRLRGSGNGEKGLYGFEALEMPNGNILVLVGHNTEAERLLLANVSYLYDDGRREDYLDGLYYFSSHSYLKGTMGKQHGGYGAYSYDRVPGPLPVQDPATEKDERVKREVLHFYRRHDERLVSEKMGATQNFPAWDMGEITVQIRIASGGFRVSLADHWINPSDPFVAEKSQFSFTFDPLDAGTDCWCTYKIAYSVKDQKAVVIKPEMPPEDKFENCFRHNVIFSVKMRQDRMAPNGLSYIHFQTCAQTEDFRGAYLGEIEYRKLEEFPYTDLI